MRLLLLLSFLGFRPVISSYTSSVNSITATTQSNRFSSTDGKEITSKETKNTFPTTPTSNKQNMSVMSTQPLTSTKLPTASSQITNLSTSQAKGTGASTAVDGMTTSSNFSSTASVTPSQNLQDATDRNVSKSKPTTTPESNTSQNCSTSPNTATSSTEGYSTSPEMSTAGTVQTTTSTQTQVLTTTESMKGNTTSGTTNDTQNNTAVVTKSKEETTQKRNGSVPIPSEVKCRQGSSEGRPIMKIEKEFTCENLVKEKGKDLAEKVCSMLAVKINLSGINTCEVQLSSSKEQLFVDVYYKVKNDQMDEILPELTKIIGKMEEDRNDSMELKKLIAMVVTGSLLLLIFLSAIVYWCSQHRSKQKDPYLTEELRTVDNGCHDNPAMDITERDSEMEEKNYCKATFLENTDGWIVPMDTHIKDELEEEDTHL
ncbi:podocalyxin [Mobula birostris]|uniref:podocalyxin n=1 Tax=Mobula birostris TaxID=1983395 RepID=UPI003B28BDAC